jgi:Oxysterol-binding protein
VCFETGGEKYLEHIGTVTVTNHKTGDQAVLQFKEAGWGGPSSRNKVEGKLLRGGEGGAVVGELVGKWDEAVARRQGGDSLQLLWQSHDLPRGQWWLCLCSFLPPFFFLMREEGAGDISKADPSYPSR